MKESLNVAAIQMVSAASLERNLADAGALIAQAADAGAQFVALPEYFCFMGKKETDKLVLAETEGKGPIQDFLSETARRHNIWLSSGSIPLVTPDPGRVFNTQLIYNPAGEQIAQIGRAHV